MPSDPAPARPHRAPSEYSDYVRRHGWDVEMSSQVLLTRIDMENVLSGIIRAYMSHEEGGGAVSEEWLLEMARSIVDEARKLKIVRVWRDRSRNAVVMRYVMNGVEWEDVAFEDEVVVRVKSKR